MGVDRASVEGHTSNSIQAAQIELDEFFKRTISWVGGEGGMDLGGIGVGVDMIKTQYIKFSKN